MRASVFDVASIRLNAREFFERLRAHLAGGGRLVTFYARPDDEQDNVVLCAVIDGSGQLGAFQASVTKAAGFHSLTRDFPSIHIFEREVFEQYAVKPHDHPWLKPVRFPGDNPEQVTAYPFYRVEGKEVHEVGVGPIHAGVIEPGHFRFMCLGETVHHLEIQLGYQHRGAEALLLARPPWSLTPLVETIAGDTSIAHAWAYCGALEGLSGVELTEPMQVARGVALELERIAMHLAGLAGLAADIAFLQGAATYGRLRTTAINTTMLLCGSRFGRGWLRPRGARAAMTAETAATVRDNLELIKRDIAIIHHHFLQARTVQHRLRGVGVLTAAQATRMGFVGMAARASGVALDARCNPTSAPPYGTLRPEIVVESAGDCWARAVLRIREIDASLLWLDAALQACPTMEPRTSEATRLGSNALAVSVCEGWRGEVVHCLETNSQGDLRHYRVQDPSLRNWFALALCMRENEIAPMHIGHARTYCFWDLFRRYLEYRGYHVVSVINYTDIDDRIMARASASAGAIDIAEKHVAGFRRDCKRLHIKDYATYTRATDFVAEQIDMVKQLVGRGHAYVVDGEVLYAIESFAPYGALSGRRLDEQEVGASGRVGEDFARKRNPADFTLWKPTSGSEPSWSTGEAAWPRGRPGWHIECSAMSTALLGGHFDVHGGGIDNMFPHHENEIAQSEPLCGRPWVRYWLHPEHLDLKEVKMSKSLGNVIGIPELLEKYSHDEVRWFYASQHYRVKLPFSWSLLEQSVQGYARIRRLVSVLADKLEGHGECTLPAGEYASLRDEATRLPRMRHHYVSGAFGAHSEAFLSRFIDAMDDDVNTPNAVAALFDYVSALYTAGIETCADPSSLLAVYRTLVRHLWVLGVEVAEPSLYPELASDCAVVDATGEGRGGDGAIDRLLRMRLEARQARDFAKADAIRTLLSEAGVSLEDTPQGPRWTAT